MTIKSVLLVDDESAILEVYGVALEMEGYRVFTAQSGDEGMKQARAHSPDLVIADINMPGGDGRSLLAQLRHDPALSATQVVLMTGHAQQTTPRHGMDLGADDFLLKPLDAATLLSCVRARFRRAAIHEKVESRVLDNLRGTLRSTLPHEFFTPLAGVLGIVQVLRAITRP